MWRQKVAPHIEESQSGLSLLLLPYRNALTLAARRSESVTDGGCPTALYFAHRDGLDQGSAGVAAYWQAIAGDVGASWDDARVRELWAADFRSWLSINPATIEVLADLKAGDTRLALLSNAGPDFGSYFRHGPLGDFFTACGLGGVRPRKLLSGCRAASRVAGRSCRRK